MTAQVTVGDVWDALDKAGLRPLGAGLGNAFFDRWVIPSRGMWDHKVAGASFLEDLLRRGIKPVASGHYGQELTLRPKAAATGSFFMMADWSDPGTTVITGVDAIAFYLGGWTPHVWTATQIKAQTVGLMLPIWVYDPSRAGSANGTSDGNSAVAALKAAGVPAGVRVVVDMEAVVDQPYVTAFRNVIAAAGYWTTVYGSASTLFGNYAQAQGPGGGWWVADWTESPFMYSHAGVWATQYHNGGTGNPSWDQSTVAVLDHLWPHIPTKVSLTATATDAASGASVSKSVAFTLG